MKLVIANWKMNPLNEKQAVSLLRASFSASRKNRSVKTVICPPFVWIPPIAKKIKKPLELGAQNCFWKEKGAFTGEVSPAMLKNLGCRWVIIGHSERRMIIKETDEIINQKIKTALKSGLQVILAVGEQKRESDFSHVSVILEEQLEKDLDGIAKAQIKNIAIAYEPIWAIGTGLSETPEGALRAALLIRKIVGRRFGNGYARNLKILYGGSVTDQNVAFFVNQEGIDGVLVGGASVDAKIFPKLLTVLK